MVLFETLVDITHEKYLGFNTISNRHIFTPKLYKYRYDNVIYPFKILYVVTVISFSINLNSR